ncbi:DNA-directed RNA polymerase subunit E'' [Candidatus Woesearchaeota archaeon]|nr:DNA-directed RNA polymerase subunit E'' [Candidatus Woesearchaeota archaeon]
MVKKKVCKTCKIFVDGPQCPICHNKQFSTNWQGRINILNPEKSAIAKRIEIKVKGEYAIKVK